MRDPTLADEPADTRMMAIVHSALKRDLARARKVLVGPSPPRGRQRELVPHLDREVAETMPVVSACLTNREWDAVEQEFFVKNKSKRELAMEGHRFIEVIDAEGYDIVVHAVPPLLRFVLIHGFGPAYRRQAKARWGAAA